MARITALLICLGILLPSVGFAESRIFLGTRTGWARTNETFTYGKYKDYRLFLVIGTDPTGNAVKNIYAWETGTTVSGDIKMGARCFGRQFKKSMSSVPKNAVALGKSVQHLGTDPINEVQNFSLLTPVRIVGKTVINTVKIGWYTVKLPAEPLVRTLGGTLVLAGSPFVTPALYTGKYMVLTGVALYGYSSSAVGGTVLMGATTGVCALDIAISPFVAPWEVFSQ